MLPRERVIEVIRHRAPDRIPVYGWIRENLSDPITRAFGSVEAFEDHYEFDLAHIFGRPPIYPAGVLEDLRARHGGTIDPRALLGIELGDPNNTVGYEPIRAAVRHHKEQRGRFVYVQTPGIFECLNLPFGVEGHLLYMAMHEDELHQVHRRQAQWNRTFALNCLDLGVDMIHVSDDWGAQRALLFSPEMWWRMVQPYHKITCDAVRERGGFLSLHSDGHIRPLLDGVVSLGYDVVHPFQESAGMDWDEYRSHYMSRFTIMGGLDVQTTLGFGRYEQLRQTIEGLVRDFGRGGLILCTSHFVQAHCSLEELTFAFDLVYRLVREPRP